MSAGPLRIVLYRDVGRREAWQREADRTVALEPNFDLHRNSLSVVTDFHDPSPIVLRAKIPLAYALDFNKNVTDVRQNFFSRPTRCSEARRL
jgi:hypothetical protein